MAKPIPLSKLKQECSSCKTCPRSSSIRFFGDGLEKCPEYMFVGAADEAFRRDVSRSIMDGVSYFTGVVKCLPANEDASADEVKACFRLLAHQVNTIDPQCVVAVGEIATRLFLGPDADVKALNGQVMKSAGGRSVIPLIHPYIAKQDEYLERKYEAGLKCLTHHLVVMLDVPF